MEIAAWLRKLGLERYAATFAENDIDSETLPHLTADDLADLGIVSVGHRRKILNAIQHLDRDVALAFSSQDFVAKPPSQYTPQHLADRILGDRDRLEGQRKRVTVLFADICRSTQITENLDPEDAAELLKPALQGMISAVHQYEGTVNKVQGDGIMALFGAPLAHEDHAVRACYAALALQERMQRSAEQSRRTHGIEIQARVGMHCGEVLVRGIGNDLTMDYDAIGPTVHLASRMEQVAVPGGIRITPEVLRLAEGFVAVEALGPVPVKGLSEPVEVFSLTGAGPAQSRLEAAAIRGLSPFVGRKEELEVLSEALSEAETGRGQTVAISGEPGVGKSRLCHEFLGSHRTKGWLTLAASGTASTEAVPWTLATRLLRTYFSIRDDDGKRQINERVLGKSMALDPRLKDKVAAILSLFGVEDSEGEWAQLSAPQRRRAILEGLKTLLARESQEQPLILALEDLHWADSESLAFLDEFLSGVTTLRTLVLANFRPEFTHTWANRPSFRQLPLAPLPEETAGNFLENALGDDPALADVWSLLLERSGRNPLFLEEYLRTLVDDGHLEGQPGAYRLSREMETIELPASLEALIAARIDRLDTSTKAFLQVAAVSGSEITAPLLAAATEQDEDTVQAGLSDLVVAQFLIETRLFPNITYGFKHVLVQEVAYGGLLKNHRVKLHHAVGTALEDLYPDRTEEFSENLAHHFEEAGDKEKAARYLLMAARKAKSRYAYTTALTYSEKGAASARDIPSAKTTEIGALVIGGEVKSLLGDVDGANAAYDAALALAEGSDLRREIANKRHHQGSVVGAGSRICYFEQGTQGETVVFVEPLAYGITWFQPVVEHLCQRYRTVSIEEQGATASGPLPEQYTFADHVADAGAVIQALDRGPVIGVGISRGSTTLMTLAAQYPNMFSKLVLVGAEADWVNADDGLPKLDDWGAAFLEDVEKRGYEDVVRDFAQEILSEQGVEEIREAYIQKALQSTPEAMLAFARNTPQGNAEKICRSIHAPTLLVHGSDDLDVPIEGARSLLKLLPNADLYVFEGRGHLPIFTATHEFCDVFDQFVQEGHVQTAKTT